MHPSPAVLGSRPSQTSPTTAVIVGAGHRGMQYAGYADQHPEQLAITAIVDPDQVRRDYASQHFRVPSTAQFSSIDELLTGPRVADVAINATMDALHVETTIPLLRAGYDILLEKPISTSASETQRLQLETKLCRRTVMICHVLRYAPFYAQIKQRLIDGEVGSILNLELTEHVSYHHMAVGYVRGKWNSVRSSGSSMLMAKACHDLDLLVWLNNSTVPTRVTSSGSLMHFRPEQAPDGAGTRCLSDCTIESTCPYSARKNYLEQGLWGVYAWHSLERSTGEPSHEEKLESLRTDNPHGRCVWHCDNTVVDHQSVLTEFSNGATGTLNVVGNAAKSCRSLKIVGTEGEIEGALEDGSYVVRRFDTRPGHEYSEERVQLDITGEMHGGGDLRLVEDFLSIIGNGSPSISATTLDDSITGHLLGFAADEAMQGGTWIDLDEYRARIGQSHDPVGAIGVSARRPPNT